jgi:predicted neutral ceramidase superfamily lipid hydrolase
MLIAFALVQMVSVCASAEFRAGAAVRIVTPDPLLPVTGGAGGAEPATKKVGELTVRALVLDKDGTRVAIVGADFLGFPGILCERVRAKVKDVPPQNIMIGSTHAHSAPDM